MSSPEQEPKDDKPEDKEGQASDGQQVEKLADQLTPAYREHVEEFLNLIPQLSNLRAYVPIGTFVQIEDWIFPVLEKCKEITGGSTAISIGDACEGWARCYGAGMPEDLPPINLYFTADIHHEKYKDFAIHAQGVLSDPENPQKGKSVWRWVYRHPITGKEFTLHLWTQMVYLRDSTTQIVAHYNSGSNDFYSSLLKMRKGVRIEMVDINPSDPTSAHLLIDSTVLFTDSQSISDAALTGGAGDINREGVRNKIRDIAKSLHLERLERPFSMLAPVPIQFPQYSKLEGKPWLAQPVMCSGLEMEALHNHYGFPRGMPQMVLTYQGKEYGPEFADFTIEYFGLEGDTSQEDEVTRISERTIGKHKVSKVAPEGLPYGSGGTLSILNTEADGACMVKIYVWRWRIFMDNSSLCLELNRHHDDATVGGWIPYLLGVDYSDPEKAVADGIRFAPAFKLCNLVDAKLSQRQGGDWRKQAIQEMWADENVLKDFARLVKVLWSSWSWIKTNVDSSASMSSSRQQEWVSDMWERDEIKPFAAKHPKFTKELLARAVDNELPGLDREPRQLAFFHAALEVQVHINGETLSIMEAYLRYQDKPLAPISLKPYFDKGKALLDRSE